MTRRAVACTIAFVLFSFFVTAAALPKAADPLPLTVHEWGTFTSVAGENGAPVAWRSYGGPSDLPCFVERFGGFKSALSGTIRMETPVLYFYGSAGASLHVSILFRAGTITEWYPKAALSRSFDAIDWHDIMLSPNAAPEFPVRGRGHYYAARETDAVPLQVGTQHEKFLFYRGVGSFALPLSARVMADGNVVVKKLGEDAVSGVILFENRKGHMRYQFAGTLENDVTLDPQLLQSNWAGLLMDLERGLIEQGLYQREARAMIETWRDSWFEEGTRLFYIVPQRAIDSVLPLEVQPAPSEIARVFVGRMEIITPEIHEDVRQAVARNDRVTLEKYGRFLEPIARRIGIKSPVLDSVLAKYITPSATCSR